MLKTHRTVTLITADNAALIISFLFKSFKQNSNGFRADIISEKDLTDQLSDYLYIINKDEIQFPRQPKQYLTDWTNAGYLRKYPIKNDEFLYELTPATENVFQWIDSLDKREFVGQESRLKNLFESLKELASKSKQDYATRIKELEEKKKRIEREIEEVKQGKIDVLDDRQIKERYFLIEETAKNLLADFKQVEQNFRELDRRFRQKIITTNLAKGKVLEDLFQQQSNLLEEDQGKSFIAFWEFLLSQSKQEEFEKILNEVLNLPAVQEVQRESFSIANVRNDLIEAGDKTKRSTNSLLEQLRKYLEHKSFTENKRIYDNIQEALKIISLNPDKDFSRLNLIEMDNVVDINLILGHNWDIRGFKPPEKIKFANNNPEEGKNSNDNNQLYEQFEISIAELKNNIKTSLKNKTHITFSDFIKEFEIKKGVAEIVAYVEIASNDKNRHIVKDDVHDFIDIKNSKTDKNFRVKVPQIIFCK
ncbi:MAG TPA: DUF3375 domain-containing protein [Parafilimonas sp.]|nr:DUF3375 domain-containing protein [Parafilimonas sp.]